MTSKTAVSLYIVMNNDQNDLHSAVATLQDEQREGNVVGLNLISGEPMDPVQEGVYDSYRVLRNYLASSAGIASNLLLCDEILKARQMVSFRAQMSFNHD